MTLAFLIAALLAVLLMLVLLTYHLRGLEKAKVFPEEEEKSERRFGFIYAAIVLVVISLLCLGYFIVRGTLWEGHLLEWLNIVVRVMHVTFGIAWIGASFYFVFLENALNRTEEVREELAGNLWAVHGGGFYYLEKYRTSPKQLPKKLHWFKYEAYFTWLSGFSLLFIVYYFNAKAFLIDKAVLDISAAMGILIGVGSFAIAWVLYDLICKTPLIKKGYWFALVGLVLLTGFAFLYTHVFSGRAAFIHFGAMIGTLMAGNVFFVIIPSQKAMVRAAKEGRPPDPELGKHAGLRSLHNNYFTLPVLFVMVSNHFPSTFGNSQPWLLLIIISLGVAGIRHYVNLRERGIMSVWVMPLSVLVLLAAAFISAPQPVGGACQPGVSMNEVFAIVQRRCASCHAVTPTDDVLTAPPNGVVLATPQDIINMKDNIMQRVVVTKTMPQNNKTGMTEEERHAIRCWIEQGAGRK